MIKYVEQKEINELSEFLTRCGIIPLDLAKKYLYKRGKTKQQVEGIINQMVKRKLAYFDSSNTYLRINKGIEVTELNKGCIKALYLFLDLIDNIGEYFILAENPHIMTFQNINSDDEDPFYDVFYIQYDTEKLNCYVLKNKFSGDTKIKAFIIVDDEKQIEKMTLPDNIEVTSFVLIDVDGNVSYL